MSEIKERNFIIGIFGDNFVEQNLIGQALGAPGAKSDIQFYDRLDNDLGHIFCALTPTDYPEKIKPFLQILNISNIHLLVIDLELGLNATIGEIIVGMDMFHHLFETKALVIISNINSKTEWKLNDTLKKIEAILNTTSLHETEIIEIKEKADYEKIKAKVVDLGLNLLETDNENALYTKVLIDHSFPVKGIGTVILGIVKKGITNANQMLELIGYEGPAKKVIIRNIQKQDRNFKTASIGERIGLALKGNITSKDISRDNILVTPGIFKAEKKIRAIVQINAFYKPKEKIIKPGESILFHAIVDLKTSPFKFTDGDELSPGKSGNVILSFEKTLFHDGTGLKGIITELGKFENKLRIVGWFSQIIK